MLKNTMPIAKACGRALAPGRQVRWLLVVGLAALVVGVIGSAGAVGANQVAAKATVTLGGPSFCTRFSPLLANSDRTSSLSDWFLINFNGFGKPYTPGSAESWKVTKGNKVITFTLRKGLRFSDGVAFDAESVKTWLEYRQKQPSAFGGTSFVGPIQSVDVLSKYVVRITLKAPNPELAYAFAQFGFNWGNVQSPRAVAEAATDPAIWARGTFGLGPYTLVKSQSVIGSQCTYRPNRFYPGASKLKFGTVVTKNMLDPNTILAAAQSGQVDVAQVATGSIAPAAQAAGLSVQRIKALVVGMYLIDHGGVNKALDDVRVRQALNYAVDRKAIVNAIYPNSGFPTSSPDPIVNGNTPKYDELYGYNPTRAKSLLASAGYQSGLTIKALAPQGGFGFGLDQLAQLVCKYWGDVGVKCDLTVQPAASWFGQLSSKRYSASAGVAAVSPPWTWFTQSVIPNANGGAYGADQHGWFDSEIRNLWLRGQRVGEKAAAPYWEKMIARGVEQAISVPIASPGVVFLVSKRVSGVKPIAPGLLSVPDWSPAST